MTTQAVASYGSVLKWNNVALAEITDIAGPGISFDTIGVTSYSSPNAFKEFIAGFGDGGEVTIEGNFISGDTTGQIAFITDAFAKTIREVIITDPADSATEWTFDALVTALEFRRPLEEQLGFTATLKISGVPSLGITYSAGISALAGIEENGGASLTLVPTFATGTYLYTTTVNTASTWIKLTVTAASHTITASWNGSETTLTSGVQSGELALGAAGTVTKFTIKVKESQKVAKEYIIYVTRP